VCKEEREDVPVKGAWVIIRQLGSSGGKNKERSNIRGEEGGKLPPTGECGPARGESALKNAPGASADGPFLRAGEVGQTKENGPGDAGVAATRCQETGGRGCGRRSKKGPEGNRHRTDLGGTWKVR